jgi:hypothetical protein
MDVGFFTSDRHICSICKVMEEIDPDYSPGAGIFGIADKLPQSEDWPSTYLPPKRESSEETLTRWRREDHDWTMRHHYWGLNPRDR